MKCSWWQLQQEGKDGVVQISSAGHTDSVILDNIDVALDIDGTWIVTNQLEGTGKKSTSKNQSWLLQIGILVSDLNAKK